MPRRRPPPRWNDQNIIRSALTRALHLTVTDDQDGFLAALQALTVLSSRMWARLSEHYPDIREAVPKTPADLLTEALTAGPGEPEPKP